MYSVKIPKGTNIFPDPRDKFIRDFHERKRIEKKFLPKTDPNLVEPLDPDQPSEYAPPSRYDEDFWDSPEGLAYTDATNRVDEFEPLIEREERDEFPENRREKIHIAKTKRLQAIQEKRHQKRRNRHVLGIQEPSDGPSRRQLRFGADLSTVMEDLILEELNSGKDTDFLCLMRDLNFQVIGVNMSRDLKKMEVEYATREEAAFRLHDRRLKDVKKEKKKSSPEMELPESLRPKDPDQEMVTFVDPRDPVLQNAAASKPQPKKEDPTDEKESKDKKKSETKKPIDIKKLAQGEDNIDRNYETDVANLDEMLNRESVAGYFRYILGQKHGHIRHIPEIIFVNEKYVEDPINEMDAVFDLLQLELDGADVDYPGMEDWKPPSSEEMDQMLSWARAGANADQVPDFVKEDSEKNDALDEEDNLSWQTTKPLAFKRPHRPRPKHRDATKRYNTPPRAHRIRTPDTTGMGGFG
eukprot:TRINITY_DN4050_c0_g1_i1.p1 TRINITY_DN4050_c0_g1~~TRINITY_DN4050_c0_g1_i1.p1  ORF type:complete len:530 (-),score=136.59 TRINITY_DN4050_c0_g1_i1:770-2173(-)